METCSECGFDLWLPIAELSVSDLSLYSDGRFPGRSIVKLRDHWESIEDVPEDTLELFLRDIRSAMAAIRETTGSERVNLAILGNTVSHVHAHLIPRFPQDEEFPGSSPWDDPREKFQLSAIEESRLIGAIRDRLKTA